MNAIKLALALALLVSISFAYTADDFFVSMDRSYVDLTSGWAEFSYYNAEPMDKAASASNINFIIQLNNTPITSQKLYLWTEVSIVVPVYKRVLVNVTCSYTDNKTSLKVNGDCSYYINNQTGTKLVSSWQWVPFKGDALKPGVKYKIRVEATWKPKVGKVSMDWVPYTKTATAATLYQSKWAWWNSSYWFCRNVNINRGSNTLNMTLFQMVINTTSWTNQPYVNSIRLTNNTCNDFNTGDIEYPTDVWNYTLSGGNKYTNFNLLMLLNMSSTINAEGNFSIYYSDAATNIANYSGIIYSDGVSSNSPLNITTGRAKFYYNTSGIGGYNIRMEYDNLTICDEGNYPDACLFQVDDVSGTGKPSSTNGGIQQGIFNGTQCHIGIRYASDFSITTYNSTFYICVGDQAYMFDGNPSTTHDFSQHIGSPQYSGGANTIYQYGIEGANYTLPFMANDYHTGGYMAMKSNTINQIYSSFVVYNNGSHNNGQYIGDPAFFIDSNTVNQYVPFWQISYYPNTTGLLPTLGFGRDMWWALYNGVATYSGLTNEQQNEPYVNVILNYPNNLATNITNNIQFGFNVTSSVGAIDSCSLYTNESGGWGITSLNASQVINNSINAFNHQFANSGQYLWNIVCQATGNISSAANRTLTLSELSNSYMPAVYELVKTPHNITFTFSNYTYASVGLVWGGSYMPATQVAANVWVVNVTPPLILTNNTAVNFNWNYTRTNSSVSQLQSTPTQSQSVYYAYTLSVASISPLTASEGQTLVGDLQIANVSSLASITAWFNGVFGAYRGYNGTLNYNQTVIATGGPAIPYSVNYTWVANISYGGNTRTMSLTTPNVSIYNLIVTACGDGNATAAVWTPYDTRTGQVLNASFNVILLLYNSGAARQYSFSISNANNFSVCIYPSTITYLANISMQYVANNYQQGTWYASGFVLNNATKYLSVYLINTTNAYLLDFTVVDQYNTRVANTYVYFQRFNYTSSSWYNETIVHTSEGGAGSVIVERYTVPYKVVIYGADGTTVLTTYDNYYISTSPVTFVTTRSFNNIYAIIQDISHSCNYDTGTKVLTCTYSDPHNAISYTNFTVATAAGASVCNAGSPLAGYTYTCDVNAYPNTTGFNFMVTVNIQGYTATLDQGNINPATTANLGNNGLLLALFIIIPLFFIGAFKPMLAIILADLGFFVSTIFGYINLGPAGGLTMGVLVGLSALILWRMRE